MTVLDIDFEWPHDLRGHEIKERNRSTALTRAGPDRTDDSGKHIVRKGGKLEKDLPLKYYPTLFVEFSNLDGKAETCIEFADKFGYLGLHPHTKDDNPPKDKVGPRGERLAEWQKAIKEMRRAVAIWRRDPRALCGIEGSETFLANLKVVLVPSPLDAMPLFRIQPRSLLGAMWLQFARVVTSPDLDVKTCNQCGEWFEAGGERRRIDAIFCSNKCRDNFNNAKKRKAS